VDRSAALHRAGYGGRADGLGRRLVSEVTAFPPLIAGPGVYCLSFKYIDFPLMQEALITIDADDVVFDLNGATLDGTPKVTGVFS
jgi:hypothetical protein